MEAAVQEYQRARAAFDEAVKQFADGIKIGRKQFRVEEDEKLDLDKRDPNDRCGLPKEGDLLRALTERELDKIDTLQERLYAEHRHKVLVVFQAMDCGGKDGAIRHLTRGMNPQGVKVACFKAPTPQESDHDPLWRIHPHMPGKGEIVIFNRSHYEDVLVTRVHKLIDNDEAQRRMGHIRDFERMASDEGTTLLKFFLHISKDEQLERLKARQDDPEKHWKLSPADTKERAFWEDYQKVFATAISATSTKACPWYVVPANHKKVRDLIVATIVRKTLADLDIQTPQASVDVASLDIH